MVVKDWVRNPDLFLVSTNSLFVRNLRLETNDITILYLACDEGLPELHLLDHPRFNFLFTRNAKLSARLPHVAGFRD
jgi:hypothetical protein